eukprot:GHVO01024903.1.p1 GENE.GHVO01024903.1~~GHVO01024903.1.p1  ORF type:complete len:167 (-),score=6.03 GHVO01024903.1:61-537(-)
MDSAPTCGYSTCPMPSTVPSCTPSPELPQAKSPHTIPRLDLMAAIVSAHASTFLQTELRYDAANYFWTDSQVVLRYLKDKAQRFHMFVANRVQTIRTLTDVDRWFYVHTDQNPADIASRGGSSSELTKSIWFNGPSFLWSAELQPQTARRPRSHGLVT